jgi:AP-2 complex subunit beta-1
MIWIVGQYADRIENAAELLESFIESFLEDPQEVQLALLTATVKLFIYKPNDAKEILPKILKWATEDVDNPDVRDRGYIYWRLLSADPVTSKDVVLSARSEISTESDNLDLSILNEVLYNI